MGGHASVSRACQGRIKGQAGVFERHTCASLSSVCSSRHSSDASCSALATPCGACCSEVCGSTATGDGGALPPVAAPAPVCALGTGGCGVLWVAPPPVAVSPVVTAALACAA